MADLQSFAMVLALILFTSSAFINFANTQSNGHILNTSGVMDGTNQSTIEQAINLDKNLVSTTSTTAQVNASNLIPWAMDGLTAIATLLFQGFTGWTLILGAIFADFGLGAAGSTLATILGNILGLATLIGMFYFVKDVIFAIKVVV